ncbi:hypothetical protein C1E24_15035 [Pseudoalteromonas phenolica]|uniref:Uncharacterized protein n=1 Tax=Pseudoalteromonas phenolica TaxID=161398 RepID=A0A5R9PZ04_9GAMM|nr:hypothetical protein [Pseudoalteromonas phenolica]TLX46081.1 hypothetical protein C1E24_15035 [Pseudoalteromonas phenolica]
MILEVLKESLGCSDNTARDALNSLVDLNLFNKAKEGKNGSLPYYLKKTLFKAGSDVFNGPKQLI